MAFGRKPEPVVESTTALVASATQVKLGGKRGPLSSQITASKWQEDAWYFFDTVGEYASGCRWVGNLLSRAILYPTFDDGSGPVRIGEEDAAHKDAFGLVDSLGGNSDGKAQILRETGVHYAVAGEAYMVTSEDEHGDDTWNIYSPSVLRRKGEQWEINGKIDTKASVIRIWEPHPNDPSKATSPSRAALPVLSQLQRLTMMADAQIDSRLAGAGLLLLPNDAVFAAGGREASSEEFIQKLTAAMSTAVANRGDASSLVPIVITADKDALEKIRHLTLDTPLDAEIGPMIDRATKRVGLALDMPPEILTGQGDSNHWTAWAIDESAIKSHTEPLLRRIALDLARGYLQPLLKGRGVEEWWRYGIGVDTTEMRLRPNRSKEAIELYDRGELGSKALLREAGFKPEDAPTKEERIFWLINKVAGGSTTPELVEAALRAIGVELDVRPAPGEGTQEARPDRSLEDHPTQAPPDEQAALLAACEQLVFRALERAGNRLKTKAGTGHRGMDSCDLYRVLAIDRNLAGTLLADAWDKTPRYLARFDVDPTAVGEALDTYTRFLFMNQAQHNQADLAKHLANIPRRAQIGHP